MSTCRARTICVTSATASVTRSSTRSSPWRWTSSSHFGLIKGELLSTDGQLEPSYSRYKGCTYACEDCQAFTLT